MPGVFTNPTQQYYLGGGYAGLDVGPGVGFQAGLEDTQRLERVAADNELARQRIKLAWAEERRRQEMHPLALQEHKQTIYQRDARFPYELKGAAQAATRGAMDIGDREQFNEAWRNFERGSRPPGVALPAPLSATSPQAPLSPGVTPPAIPMSFSAQGQDTVALQSLPPALQQWMPSIVQHANRVGIDPGLLARVIWQESKGDPNAVPARYRGKPNAPTGLGQIRPNTARDPGYGVRGIDPATLSDPEANIAFTADYLAGMIRHAGGDVLGGLYRFNAGPGNIAKGIIPLETRAYGEAILNPMQFTPGAPNAPTPPLAPRFGGAPATPSLPGAINAPLFEPGMAPNAATPNAPMRGGVPRFHPLEYSAVPFAQPSNMTAEQYRAHLAVRRGLTGMSDEQFQTVYRQYQSDAPTSIFGPARWYPNDADASDVFSWAPLLDHNAMRGLVHEEAMRRNAPNVDSSLNQFWVTDPNQLNPNKGAATSVKPGREPPALAPGTAPAPGVPTTPGAATAPTAPGAATAPTAPGMPGSGNPIGTAADMGLAAVRGLQQAPPSFSPLSALDAQRDMLALQTLQNQLTVMQRQFQLAVGTRNFAQVQQLQTAMLQTQQQLQLGSYEFEGRAALTEFMSGRPERLAQVWNRASNGEYELSRNNKGQFVFTNTRTGTSTPLSPEQVIHASRRLFDETYRTHLQAARAQQAAVYEQLISNVMKSVPVQVEQTIRAQSQWLVEQLKQQGHDFAIQTSPNSDNTFLIDKRTGQTWVLNMQPGPNGTRSLVATPVPLGR